MFKQDLTKSVFLKRISAFFVVCLVLLLVAGSLYAQPSFTENVISTGFNEAQSVVAVDLDYDGDIDLLGAAAADDKISWWENDGNENFTENVITNSFTYPVSVKACDIDGDGDLDIIGAGFLGDNVSWWENDGNQNFTESVIDNSFIGSFAVDYGDIDGDGDLDVVGAALTLEALTWWENTAGDGSAWTDHAVILGFWFPRSVHLKDVDRDGDIDILSTSSNNDKVSWFENDSQGQSFTENIISSTFNGASDVCADDIDFDGDIDVLAVAGSDSLVTWWENDGAQNWTEHLVADDFNGASSIIINDLDFDGDLDYIGSASVDGEISWWENDGNQSFLVHTITSGFGGAADVFSLDIDLDGDVDICGVAETDDELTWWSNDTDRPDYIGFAENNISSTLNGASGSYPIDLDLDGDIDILATSYDDDEVAWFENDGNQGFTHQVINNVFDGAKNITAADFDGDGDYDVVAVAKESDQLTWWENDGFQVFSETNIATGFDGNIIDYADLDGDGDLDIFGGAETGDNVKWWENTNGDASVWTEYVIDAGFNHVSSIKAEDLDRDGDLDLVGASYDDNEITLWENVNGDASSWTTILVDTYTSITGAEIVDLDLDGDLDVLASSDTNNEVTWWENDGNLGWTTHTISDTISGASSLLVNDFDYDGNLDIVVSSASSNYIIWLQNDGSENFSGYIIDPDFAGVSFIYAYDLDRDADLDLVGTAVDDNELTWWENSPQSFQPPLPFDILSPSDLEVVDSSSVTLSWETAVDLDPGDVIEYVVWWATDAGFSQDLDSTTINSTSFELTGLVDDQSYWWKVRAQDTNSSGTWSSSTWSFSTFIPDPPSFFSLVQPADGFTNQVNVLTLEWESTTDPDPGDVLEYVVWWANDAGFTVNLDSVTTLDTTWNLSALLDDETYWWRVRAQDTNTSGTWSDETWTFSTDIADPPNSFSLLSPADGSICATGDTILTWETTTDPDPGDILEYVVWWATDVGFSTNLDSATTLDTTWNLNALLDDETYWWKVRAQDTNTAGRWSDETWTFSTYVGEPPISFSLASPADGSVCSSGDTILTWETTTDPDPGDIIEYVIWWATDEGFTVNLDSATTSDTTLSLTSLLDDETYWWKVRAQDSNTAGTWSDETFSFSVYIPDPPSVIDLISPPDGALFGADSVSFSWTSSSDPDPGDIVGYVLLLATDADFIADLDSIVLFDTTRTINGLEDDQEYWWKVRAQDTNTGGTWSNQTNSFEIYIPQPPGAFNLLTPTDEEIVATLEPTLTWEESVDPDPDDFITYTLIWSINDPLFVSPDSVTNLPDPEYTFSEEQVIQGIENYREWWNGELDELEDDITLYWYIKAYDQNTGMVVSNQNPFDGTQISFSINVADLPGSFSLLSPDDNYISPELSVNLGWESSTDPDPDDLVTYELYITTNPDDFGNAFAQDIADTNYTFISDTDDTEYWWTIHASDNNTGGRWARDTLSFSIDIPETPEDFTLISPLNGEEVSTLTPLLTWQSTSDADGDSISYVLYWATNPTFNNADSIVGLVDTVYVLGEEVVNRIRERKESPTGKNFVPADSKAKQSNKVGTSLFSVTGQMGNPVFSELDDLSDDITVYWKIRALDENTTGTWSTPETGWLFNIYVPDPPDPFNLIFPANGDTSWTGAAVFTWEETEDPDPGDEIHYVLHYATDIEFFSNHDTVVTPYAYTPIDNLLDDSTYYWQVNARDTNTQGRLSEGINALHIYIPDNPEPFYLVGPENGSTVGDSIVTVTWNHAYDPDPGDEIFYQLEWSIREDFGGGASIITSDTFFVIDDLEATVASMRSGNKNHLSKTLSSDQPGANKYKVSGKTVNNIEELNEIDALPDDVTIYWRVSAVDGFGLEADCIPGIGYSFNVSIPEPPTSFSLQSPADSSILATNSVLLDWYRSYDPDPGDMVRYSVWWSYSDDFTEDTDSVSGLEEEGLQLIGLEDDQTIWWKVRAQDINTEGTWSNQVFQVNISIPELRGNITDIDDGSPISDALLTLYKPDGETYQTSTNNTGYFEFHLVPTDQYSLRITHPQYATSSVDSLEIAAGLVAEIDFGLNSTVSMDQQLEEYHYEMVSFYFEPSSLIMTDVFGHLDDLLVVADDQNRMFIAPAYNTIGNISISEGYRVLVSDSSRLNLNGSLLNPFTEYTLEEDKWNILGYPFDFEVPVEIALEPILPLLEIIQNDDGYLYIPGVENTIQYLVPGEGYLARVTEDVEFVYSRGEGFFTGNSIIPTREPMPGEVKKTGLPYTIIVNMDKSLENLEDSYIEIYDGALLVGKNSVDIENRRAVVTAWQGDPQFDMAGFIQGNQVGVKLKSNAGIEIPVDIYQGSQLFGEGAYADFWIKEGVLLPSSFAIQCIFPNPFNSSLKINFGLPGDGNVHIEMFNLLGQSVFSDDKYYQGGINEFVLETERSLVSGLYFIRLRYKSSELLQKAVLLK